MEEFKFQHEQDPRLKRQVPLLAERERLVRELSAAGRALQNRARNHSIGLSGFILVLGYHLYCGLQPTSLLFIMLGLIISLLTVYGVDLLLCLRVVKKAKRRCETGNQFSRTITRLIRE